MNLFWWFLGLTYLHFFLKTMDDCKKVFTNRRKLSFIRRVLISSIWPFWFVAAILIFIKNLGHRSNGNL
jgi:hypothetical protein